MMHYLCLDERHYKFYFIFSSDNTYFMKTRNTIFALLLTPFLMQGLCKKEDVKADCTEKVTFDGSALNGFDSSILLDSHFRDLYFKAIDLPIDICPDSSLKVTFKVDPLLASQITNVNQIEGVVSWGDQEKRMYLFYFGDEDIYKGTIDDIDVSDYFDAHPTTTGAANIETTFVFHNLSVGSESDDIDALKNRLSGLTVSIEYVKQ